VQIIPSRERQIESIAEQRQSERDQDTLEAIELESLMTE